MNESDNQVPITSPKKRARAIIIRAVALVSIALVLFVAVMVNIYLKDADPEAVGAYFSWGRARVNPPKPGIIYFGYSPVLPTRVDLSWYYPMAGETVEFIIERAKGAPEGFEVVAKRGRDLEHEGHQWYQDLSLETESKYFYRVSACVKWRCVASPIKELRTAPPPSLAPADLTAEILSPYEVRLRWRDRSKHELGFLIEREEDGFAEPAGKVGPDQTTFTDCRLAPRKTYIYRVKALDKYCASKNNPSVSITTPNLEWIGRLAPAPELDASMGSASLAFGGGNWGAAFSTRRDSPADKYPDSEYDEIYFLLLDPDGAAAGPSVRVSQAPGESSDPSLAWSGSEYGVAWTDSRFAPTFDCDGNEDCDMHREVFFRRVSKEGRPLGPELRLTGPEFWAFYPRLFWRQDHYDLIFGSLEGLYYLRLKPGGRKVGEPRRIAPRMSVNRPQDVAPAGEGYGLCWRVGDGMERSLYFLHYRPDDEKTPEPTLISGDTADPISCSIVWTGSTFAVFWGNHQRPMLSLITGAPDAPAVETRSLRSLASACPRAEDPGEKGSLMNVYLEPLAVWNGSEFGLIGWRAGRSKQNRGLVFARLSPEGEVMGEEKNLGLANSSSRPVWDRTRYFMAGPGSILVFSPTGP